VYEVKIAQQLRFAPGTINADNRVYNGYRIFGRWCAHGVCFVTRMKVDARYAVVERRLLAPNGKGVLTRLYGLAANARPTSAPTHSAAARCCSSTQARPWCS